MAREEKGTQVSSYDEGPSISKTSADERDTSLSARRTRLRELAKSNLTVNASVAKVKENPEPVMHSVSEIQDSNPAIVDKPAPVATIPPTPAPPTPQMQAAAVQVQALEVLNHIDQAMESCAVNLATLQKAAIDQTETLKILAKTLQNQTFSEISLNLSSLTESLSAALEPMKAVGELIPSLDELVNVINTRESHEPPSKLSTDDLLISLSEQLASGHIDPWTFKCACLAVANEQPADLLRRLVDLLSAQSLSGDVFQVAREAIQEAEPEGLRHSMVKSHEPSENEFAEMLTREAQTPEAPTTEVQQSAEVQTSSMQTTVTSTPDNFDFLEQSQPGQIMPSKSELSLDQLEEVNKRYDELNEAFLRHERVLQERETELLQRQQELQQKDSENKMLKAQMDELLERTEELAKELQRQAVQPKPEVIKEEVELPSRAPQPEIKPSPSFFDMDSSHQSSSLFDTARQPVSLFEQTARDAEDQTLSLERRNMSDINQAPVAKDNGAKAPVPSAKNVEKPQASSANSPFVSGAGSYGSGVRAQVFEVIVRQALAGAEWREICSGPMQVNNISPEEVDSEVKRRQALLKK